MNNFLLNINQSIIPDYFVSRKFMWNHLRNCIIFKTQSFNLNVNIKKAGYKID